MSTLHDANAQVLDILGSVFQVVSPAADLIPGVGEFVAAAVAFADAGVDIAQASTDTSIDFEGGDRFTTLCAGNAEAHEHTC